MKNVLKRPLDLEEYQHYEIDQQYTAYVIILDQITQQEAEDFEYDYLLKGHKIFSSQLERRAQKKFQLKLIIAKLPLKM